MIYMLEDDGGIRAFVTYALNNSGYETAAFETPSAFRAALAKELPELILLDIMLPEEDGLSVLRSLRSAPDTADIPVIMLTAKGTEYDKVAGLDSGADDYVAKPFGIMELISRVKALLRRSGGASGSGAVLSSGGVTIHPQKHTVTAGGSEISLTHKEYELLLLMMKNKGTVFSRDELLRQVWGYDFAGESRTVDVHIRTLRAKLGDCGDVVQTVRGAGYKVVEDK
ncbi:MAG: response regulator transcription factor [Ruminococcus sp.]|nr:response regulator transcription factor [Ruminococcus sp.]